MIVSFNGASGWDQTRFIRGPWNQSGRFNPVVGPIDCPWLIVLQHPASVTLDANGLTLDSGTSLEHVVMMPLFGSEKLNPQKTAGWGSQAARGSGPAGEPMGPLFAPVSVVRPGGLPDRRRARRGAHPQPFRYVTIEDDWKTQPAVLAPVSPVTALAYTSGFRISFDTNPRDLQMVTHWGPLLGVLDRDTYEYTLTGILKYVDEEQVVSRARTNVPGFEDARRLLIARIESAAAGGADPRGAYSVDWGMGMISAWMRATRYVPEGLARRLTGYIRKQDLIAGHFFNPANDDEVSLSLGARTLAIPVFKASKGQQTYGDDLVKQTSRMPYVAWQYGYYSGDWSDDSSPIRLHQADVRLQPSAGLVERRTGGHGRTRQDLGKAGRDRPLPPRPALRRSSHLRLRRLPAGQGADQRMGLDEGCGTCTRPTTPPGSIRPIPSGSHTRITGTPESKACRSIKCAPTRRFRVLDRFNREGTRGLQRFLRAHAASIRTE